MPKNNQPNRKIDTQGGAYIEGGVNTGGDFVGRDQNKVTVQGGMSGGTLVVGNHNQVNSTQTGASVAELSNLVGQIRALLPQARLDEDTQGIIDGDFQVVETQLAKPEPKKALVLPKLEGIAKMLTTAAAAGEAVQKLAPMLQQAVTWAQQVLK